MLSAFTDPDPARSDLLARKKHFVITKIQVVIYPVSIWLAGRADSQVYRIIIDRSGIFSTFGASDIAPLTAEPQHSRLALSYARPTRTKASGPCSVSQLATGAGSRTGSRTPIFVLSFPTNMRRGRSGTHHLMLVYRTLIRPLTQPLISKAA